ncbi:hypothetical protein [Oxynema aestuarii]|jgi:hypothetical protein|uniref:Uncharacterized protein n=1 Tax=Oxynema aestuarii AP17 TaxID=2064643 RepID=A0A6H1U1S7_9CYAN|nr:hypothetical protein [Oxynema aestuarii]QIZ72828.1 hypothetical protein HCG48_21330 [Oxynema aestuarii AP17]
MKPVPLSALRISSAFVLSGLLALFHPNSTPGLEMATERPGEMDLPEYSLDGVIVVMSPTSGDPCATSGEGAIVADMPIWLENSDGKPIARGTLGEGQPRSLTPHNSVMVCHFPFKIPGIPKLRSYDIKIDRQSTFLYGHDQLEQKNWYIELTFMDPSFYEQFPAAAAGENQAFIALPKQLEP